VARSRTLRGCRASTLTASDWLARIGLAALTAAAAVAVGPVIGKAAANMADLAVALASMANEAAIAVVARLTVAALNGNTAARAFLLLIGMGRVLQNCFPADTVVAAESGLRPIGEIKAGEKVWAYDCQGGDWRLCEVECRHDNVYDGQMVTVDFGDGRTVRATQYHPFWVAAGEDLAGRPTPRHLAEHEDQGGALAGRWVNSHELRPGDVLVLRNGRSATVRAVTHANAQTRVCNLTVRGLHTFAVGDVGVLVHNTSGSVPQFLGAPQLIGGKLSGDIPSRLPPGLTQEQAYAALTDVQVSLATRRAQPGPIDWGHLERIAIETQWEDLLLRFLGWK
jgi:hypothetical protein